VRTFFSPAPCVSVMYCMVDTERSSISGFGDLSFFFGFSAASARPHRENHASRYPALSDNCPRRSGKGDYSASRLTPFVFPLPALLFSSPQAQALFFFSFRPPPCPAPQYPRFRYFSSFLVFSFSVFDRVSLRCCTSFPLPRPAFFSFYSSRFAFYTPFFPIPHPFRSKLQTPPSVGLLPDSLFDIQCWRLSG